jgi:chromosome segregation ATPase
MAIREQLNNIERVLGQLLEGDRQSQEDRRVIKGELRATNDKLNTLAPLSDRLDEHLRDDKESFNSLEQEGAERHEENKDTLSGIQDTLRKIETWRNRKIGFSTAIYAVGSFIAGLIAALGVYFGIRHP